MAVRDKQYDSALLVYTKRRFYMLLIALISIISIAVFLSVYIEQNWLGFVAPISAVGLLLAFFPETEVWEYKAWQSKPCLYEEDLDT